MFGFLRNIWRRTDGASAVEFGLVCVPLLVITIGIMEFSFALYQWNVAEKATQMGARIAAVSDTVATGLDTYQGLDTTALLGSAPMTDFSSSAGSAVVCTGDGSTGTCTNVKSSVYGGAYLAAAHNRIVNRMRTIFPRVTASNVVVEYKDIGLGFVGRCGPVPAVTVRLQNMSFDFIVINLLISLLPGVGSGGVGSSIAMPEFAATMVGEDLNTQGDGCL